MCRLGLFFGALALVCAATLIEAQLEACHTTIMTPHHFMDMNRMKGRWYPLKLAPSKAFQVYPLNFTCPTVDVVATQNASVYKLNEAWTDIDTGKRDSATSDIVLGELRPEMPIPALWSLYYRPEGSNATINTHSVVLASNEDEWFVEYHCGVKNSVLEERITLYSRQRFLDPVIEKVLNTFMYGIGFPYANFRTVDQGQC